MRHLQTSNFCHEAPNKSERPDSKYEEGDRNKWSLNSEEEQHSSREEKEPIMYQDEKEEPEDLTSSIERLRRFAFI